MSECDQRWGESAEESERWWGFADMKAVLLWELCMWVKGACTRCIQLWNHETNPTNCRKNESKKHRPWSQAELRRLGRRQQHKVYCGSRTEHETTEETAPTHSALSPAHKQWICYRRFMTYRTTSCAFSAFDTVGWASGRAPGLQKLNEEVLVWLSACSEVQIVCIWSSWYHCHHQTPSSLALLV